MTNLNVTGGYYSPHVLKQQVLLNPDMLSDRGYYNSTGVTHTQNPYEIQVMPNNGTNPAAGNQAAQPQPENGNTPDVNKNDGKIGFWKASWNFLKGCGKLVTNLFCDEKGNPSLWQTLKNAALATAICLIPGAPAVALAIGGLLSTIGLAQGISEMNESKTDTEDAQAWQKIGTNTFALVLSIFGARAYAKGNPKIVNKNGNDIADSSRYNSWFNGTRRAIGRTFSQSVGKGFKNIFEGASNLRTQIPDKLNTLRKSTNKTKTLKDYASKKYKQGKKYVGETGLKFCDKLENGLKTLEKAKQEGKLLSLTKKKLTEGVKAPFVTVKGKAFLASSVGVHTYDDAA